MRMRRMGMVLGVAGLVLVACQPTGGGGRNHLGSGSLLAGADRENVWLAVSGPCSPAEQGDLLSAVSQANFSTATNPPSSPNAYVGCEPGAGGTVEANPDHQPLGYAYNVDVPSTYEGGPLDVQLFDAGYCGANSGAGDMSGAGFTTTFELYGPITSASAPLAASFSQDALPQCQPTCEAGGPGLWCTLHTIADPVPGSKYVLNVRTSTNDLGTAGQQGTNQFGVRVVEPGQTAVCGSYATDADYGPDCPAVRANGWASYMLNLSGATTSFSIARLSETDAGKVLRVWLWDVGEGSQFVRVLDPTGTARTFHWEVEDRSGADVTPSGGWGGITTSLDVSGAFHPQPGPHRLSGSRYNDRLLVLDVALGDDPAAVAGEWHLQVGAGTAPTDRMTLRTAVSDPGAAEPS